jgi:hypothetical protein
MFIIENEAVTKRFIKFIKNITTNKDKFVVEYTSGRMDTNDRMANDVADYYSVYLINPKTSSKILILTLYNFIYYGDDPTMHAIIHGKDRMIIIREKEDQDALLMLIDGQRTESSLHHATVDLVKYFDSLELHTKLQEEEKNDHHH